MFRHRPHALVLSLFVACLGLAPGAGYGAGNTINLNLDLKSLFGGGKQAKPVDDRRFNQITAEVKRLFEEGMAAANAGNFRQALASFRKALELAEPVVAEDDYNLMSIHSQLGQAYFFSDPPDFERAETHLRKGLEGRTKKLGRDDPITLKSRLMLLTVQEARRGRDKATLAERQDVCRKLEAKLGRDHEHTRYCLSNLAFALVEQGRYEEAEPLMEEMLAAARRNPGNIDYNSIIDQINYAHFVSQRGDDWRALEISQTVHALAQSRFGPDHRASLLAQTNYAGGLKGLGRVAESMKLREDALARYRRLFPELPDEAIHPLLRLAEDYADAGRVKEGEAMVREALGLMTRRHGENDARTWQVMSSLSGLISNLPGRANEALEMKRTVYERTQKRYGDEHPETADALDGLRVGLHNAKRFEEAAAVGEKSLAQLRRLQGEAHHGTIHAALSLARTYGAMERHEDLFRHVDWAVEAIEQRRSLPGFSSEGRQQLLSGYIGELDFFSDYYGHHGDPVKGFMLNERRKGRTLLETISSQRAVNSPALPPGEREKLAALEKDLKTLEAEQVHERSQPRADASRLLQLTTRHDQAQKALLALHARLRKDYPRFAALSEIRLATPDKARTLLAPDDLYLGFALDKKTGPAGWALDASGEPRHMKAKSIYGMEWSIETLRTLIANYWGDESMKDAFRSCYRVLQAPEGYYYMQLIDDGGGKGGVSDSRGFSAQSRGAVLRGIKAGKGKKRDAGDTCGWAGLDLPRPEVKGTPRVVKLDAALEEVTKSLSSDLLDPVLPHMQGKRRLIISPDSALAMLPFDALRNPATGNYLGSDFTITVVQSFSIFALLKEREAEYSSQQYSKQLLSLAVQKFLDRDPPVGAESCKLFNQAMTGRGLRLTQDQEYQAMGQLCLNWGELENTLPESRAIGRLFSKDNADLFLEDDATEQRWRGLNQSGELRQYRYVHFATHGYFSASNPKLSSIVLNLRKRGPGADGYLTSEEWTNFNMRSQLAVLSACNTARGSTAAGEGVQGLPYAMFIAGNQNLLLTLWPLADEPGKAFMESFFARLRKGMPQSDALSETKREFIRHKNPDFRQPANWSIFVLYGV